jgi:hypothetical protein
LFLVWEIVDAAETLAAAVMECSLAAITEDNE